MRARFRIILLTVLLELWLQVLLSSTEMVEVPIIGRKTQRIVSRVTRGLRLHKRQLGRFTQHLKPAKEIDPIPEGPKVLMPRISPEEMKKYIDQAADQVRFRMESTEPSIYRSASGVKEREKATEKKVNMSLKHRANAKNCCRQTFTYKCFQNLSRWNESILADHSSFTFTSPMECVY